MRAMRSDALAQPDAVRFAERHPSVRRACRCSSRTARRRTARTPTQPLSWLDLQGHDQTERGDRRGCSDTRSRPWSRRLGVSRARQALVVAWPGSPRAGTHEHARPSSSLLRGGRVRAPGRVARGVRLQRLSSIRACVPARSAFPGRELARPRRPPRAFAVYRCSRRDP